MLRLQDDIMDTTPVLVQEGEGRVIWSAEYEVYVLIHICYVLHVTVRPVFVTEIRLLCNDNVSCT